MKQRKLNWMLGTILTASLAMSIPAHAATKGGTARIAAAKIHHVTQITNRDVVLSRNPGVKAARLARVAYYEYGRQVLVPNTDAQRQVLVPNTDAQRQVLVPNTDAQRQVLVPNTDAQRQVLVPNTDAQRQVLVPNTDAQ